ncbi:MAG: 16S rRNA (uracil(1498)-N(3))-methyltransferase [Betaproteobacteria bacterium]
MTAPRFLCPPNIDADAIGGEIVLPDAVAHHALRVLRLAVGDAMTLFTGEGGEFAATLIRADKRNAVARIDGFDPVERESSLRVTLVQGIAANDAMDHAVRRSVELGVAMVQPILTAHSARMPDGERGEKRLAHWRQIVVSACEQCGRNRVPEVLDALPFDRWLTARPVAAAGLVLAPDAGATLAALPRPLAALDVLIGPEGGFSAEEIAVARRAGLTAVRLGPRVLRTETAALAALATINALWGDFR